VRAVAWDLADIGIVADGVDPAAELQTFPFVVGPSFSAPRHPRAEAASALLAQLRAKYAE